MIKEIMIKAKMLGACGKLDRVSGWRELSDLFFSPQGQEFCENHLFPDIQEWEEIKKNVKASRFGIFINAGDVMTIGKENIALIGETNAKCYFSTPQKPHTVVLMHGASAQVTASNYAVVRIVRIGTDCKVEISKDETVKILW